MLTLLTTDDLKVVVPHEALGTHWVGGEPGLESSGQVLLWQADVANDADWIGNAVAVLVDGEAKNRDWTPEAEIAGILSTRPGPSTSPYSEERVTSSLYGSLALAHVSRWYPVGDLFVQVTASAPLAQLHQRSAALEGLLDAIEVHS